MLPQALIARRLHPVLSQRADIVFAPAALGYNAASSRGAYGADSARGAGTGAVAELSIDSMASDAS